VDCRLVERVITLGGNRWSLVRHVYSPSVAAWVLAIRKSRSVLLSPGPAWASSWQRPTGSATSCRLRRVPTTLPYVRADLLILVVVLLIFAIAGVCESICCVGTERRSTRDDGAVTDLYIRIREQPREVLDTIARSLNVRASECHADHLRPLHGANCSVYRRSCA
jgi:hypothetical protein